jgi:hypothetical protein
MVNEIVYVVFINSITMDDLLFLNQDGRLMMAISIPEHEKRD